MTTLLIDGFDHYGTVSDGSAAMLTAMYVEVPQTVNPTSTAGPDVPLWGTRTGSAALAINGTIGGDCYRSTLTAPQTNLLVSCGFSVSNLPSADSDQGVVSFRDTNNHVLAELWLSTAGMLELRGPYVAGGSFTPGTILATTPNSVITPSVWHFLEMQIDVVAGTFVLRVDDIPGNNPPSINATGLTFGITAIPTTVATQPIVNIAILQRTAKATPTVSNAWVDDFVIRNNSGLNNNTFTGSTFVATTYPVSSYIPPIDLPSESSFSLSQLPPVITRISSINVVTTAYKTGAGAASIETSLIGISGGVTNDPVHALSSTPKYFTDIFEVSPDGGQLIPVAVAKGGIELSTVTADLPVRLTQIAELIVYQIGVPVKTRQWSWSFILDGHTFYVLDLGEEGTFAYDIITKEWCHLYTQGFGGQWNFANGTMWGDRIIAGDLLYNIAWELDPNQANDEGWRTIRHVVTGGVSTRSREWSGCAFLRLVGSSGLTQSTTPSSITLNFSDNNGRTWSSDYPIDIKSGDVDLDIQWPALGSFSTPGRIFRLTDQGGMIRIDGCDVSLTNYKNTNNDGDR